MEPSYASSNHPFSGAMLVSWRVQRKSISISRLLPDHVLDLVEYLASWARLEVAPGGRFFLEGRGKLVGKLPMGMKHGSLYR